MKVSDLSVEYIEGSYKVCDNGIPFGRSRDFYSDSKSITLAIAQNPFPFTKVQNSFEIKKEAQIKLEAMKKHMRAVIALPDSKKVGSSKWWSE